MPGTGGPPAKTGNLAIPPLGLCPANIHRLRRRDQPITPHRNGHRAQFSDGLLVLQRRLDVLLRESFVAQVLLRHLYDVHLRREWASGKRPVANASL